MTSVMYELLFVFTSKIPQICCSLLLSLLSMFRSSPTRQLDLTGRFRVPHHELDILQVPRLWEPNGVWEEDEEDSRGDDQEKGGTQAAVREELVID